MSSRRPMTLLIFARVRPHAQVSRRSVAMSPVRYRSSGSACLVTVLNTTSPGVPSGTGWVVAGSIASTTKWSSLTCSPSAATTHSAATPGPMTSDSP